jgi:hypothetical protein
MNRTLEARSCGRGFSVFRPAWKNYQQWIYNQNSMKDPMIYEKFSIAAVAELGEGLRERLVMPS